jgi:hypothetical protein
VALEQEIQGARHTQPREDDEQSEMHRVSLLRTAEEQQRPESKTKF